MVIRSQKSKHSGWCVPGALTTLFTDAGESESYFVEKIFLAVLPQEMDQPHSSLKSGPTSSFTASLEQTKQTNFSESNVQTTGADVK